MPLLSREAHRPLYAVGAFLLVLVLLWSCSNSQAERGARNVLTSFFDAVAHGDLQEATRYLVEPAGDASLPDEIEGTGTNLSYDIQEVRLESARRAVALVRVPRETGSAELTVRLRKTDDGWRLADFVETRIRIPVVPAEPGE